MKIILGLLLTALPCFGLGWYAGGSWKQGLEVLLVYVGVICFVIGLNLIGY